MKCIRGVSELPEAFRLTKQIRLLTQLAEVGGLEEEGNEEQVLCSYRSRAGVPCLLPEARLTCATEVLTSTKTTSL